MSAPSPSSSTRTSTPTTIDAAKTTPSTETPWSVQSVLTTLPPPTPTTPPSTPIPFLHLLSRLKTTPREGWRRFGIHNGESISDHMYRMSIITTLAPPSLASKLDIQRCTRMALVHDMAESLVGDITPQDNVPKEEKARREAETMEYLCGTLLGAWGGGKQGEDIKAIFQEYEEGKTSESIFVHDVDKMELLLQMVEYERKAEGQIDLGQFEHVATKIQMEEVKVWAREILKERREFWERMGKVPRYVEAAEDI